MIVRSTKCTNLAAASRLVVLLALWGSSASAQRVLPEASIQQQSGEFVLEEIKTVTLPETFELTGVHARDVETVVAWGRGSPKIILYDSRIGHTSIPLPDSASVLGAHLVGNSPESLEVEVLLGRRLIRVSRSGTVLAEKPVLDVSQITSAIYRGAEWYVAAEEHGGTRTIVGHVSWSQPRFRAAGTFDHDHVTPTKDPWEQSPMADWASLMRISDGHQDRVLLMQLGAPHELILLGLNGDVLSRSTPSETVHNREFGSAWISSAAFFLGDVIVQQLVDLRSDERRVVVYDRDLRYARRSTDIQVPLAFVTRTLAGPLHLWAARTIGDTELVAYRVSPN